MTRMLCLYSLACLLLAAPPGHAESSAAVCARLEQQRDRIHAQLRKGHSVTQARVLKTRLRELQSRISQECR